MLLRLALLILLIPVLLFVLPTVLSMLSASSSDPARPAGPARAPVGSSSALFPSSPVATSAPIAISGRECVRIGTGPVSAAAAGNDATSCDFAVATRQAYADAVGSREPTGATTLSVWSAARGQNVPLTCAGRQPVTCRSSEGALVYLYGGQADFNG